VLSLQKIYGFITMAKIKDKDIKELLQDHLEYACKKTGISIDAYKVSAMLKIRRYDSMKSGYYVTVQNFKNLTKAKETGDKNIRYYFRVIHFKNRSEPLFEISKWIPSYGNVENYKTIFRSDEPKRYKGTFIKRLITTLEFFNLKM